MVEIRPLKALRYNQKKVDLSKVISPPYDIISENEQEILYQNNAYNIIRLEYGKISDDDDDRNNRYTRANEFLIKWLKENVLEKDDEPGIYVYQMNFDFQGKILSVNSMICLLGLEELGSGVKAHEMTYSKHKEDRLNLLKKTKTSFSQIYGIYTKSNPVEEILAEKTKEKPLMDLNDERAVKHKLWKITDKESIQKIREQMKEKEIFIADGHHRYETALNYQKHLNASKDDPSNYIAIVLTNMENENLVVLPIHRMIKIPDYNLDKNLEKLSKFFEIKRFIFNEEERSTGKRRILQYMRETSKTNFCLYFKGGVFYHLTLKDKNSINEFIDNKNSLDWNNLDVMICQKLIIEQLLVKVEDDVMYTKNDDLLISKVEEEEFQIGILLNPPKVSQVKNIANNDEKMPHKTTYFYPKPICGLVMYNLGGI